MIQELTLIGTFLGLVTALCLMFIPSLIELRHPQDAGPRLILENFVVLPALASIQPAVLVDLEGEAHLIMTRERFLHFLTNLESAFSE